MLPSQSEKTLEFRGQVVVRHAAGIAKRAGGRLPAYQPHSSVAVTRRSRRHCRRNFTEGDGDIGIMRSPVRAIAPPDQPPCAAPSSVRSAGGPSSQTTPPANALPGCARPWSRDVHLWASIVQAARPEVVSGTESGAAGLRARSLPGRAPILLASGAESPDTGSAARIGLVVGCKRRVVSASSSTTA